MPPNTERVFNFGLDERPEDSTIGMRVFRALRDAIVTLQIRPGDMLSEADTSRRMGISRQPVREAFIKLSEIGLVKIVPQRGTFVVKISIDEVMNAQFVREAIEIAIARMACEAADEADFDKIRDVIQDQKEALEQHDNSTFLKLDETFHRQIAVAAGRLAARRSIDAVKAQMDRVRYLTLPLRQHMPSIISWHETILAAIERRDADAAEAAMRGHLSEFLAYLPEVAARHPDLFPDAPDIAASATESGRRSMTSK